MAEIWTVRFPSSTTSPGHAASMMCAFDTYSFGRSTSVASTATARAPSGVGTPAWVITFASGSSRNGPIS